MLPLVPGRSLSAVGPWRNTESSRADGHFDSVEVIVAGQPARPRRRLCRGEGRGDGESHDDAIYVSGRRRRMVVDRPGGAARGDGRSARRPRRRAAIILRNRWHRGPRPGSNRPLRRRRGRSRRTMAAPVAVGTRRLRASALISRLVLGTSDVFSGLFALDRSVWERAGSNGALGKSPVLDSLLRRPARCIDVKVGVDDRFQSRQARFSDLRPLKHVLDSRFGNYSRLVQFCMVGASGMVVDLTLLRALAVALVVHGAGHSQIGPFRRYVAPGRSRPRLRSRSPGLELHPEPAIDLQRRHEEGHCRASSSPTCFRTRWRSR